MNEAARPHRPALRWHGGKWRIAPWIIRHLPTHRVYVEPFGGAASVLLSKPRSYGEVYNDLDGEVVNLFRCARDRGDELRAVLTLTPSARAEFDLSYEAAIDDLERARRLVVRSFMGFGSNVTKPIRDGRPMRTGFRATCRRSGSTPARDWHGYPQALEAIVRRLQGVVIENRAEIEVMRQHDAPDTVHYVDPPYLHSVRDDARADYRHEMGEADHRALAETLHDLRGAVVLSGYDSPLYSELFGAWRRVEKHTHADGARRRVEVLWLSPRCPPPGLFS